MKPYHILILVFIFLFGLLAFAISKLPDLSNNGYPGQITCYQFGNKVLEEEVLSTEKGKILHNGQRLYTNFDTCSSKYDEENLVPLSSWVTK